VAKIEELVRQISDAKLRDEIAAEIRELKKRKRFGLVFEEHLPEMLRLPKAKIRLGNLVAHRDAPGSEVWRVIGINGKKAKCRQPITPGKYDQEVVKEFGLEELVLVVSFGEPIYPILTPIDRFARGGPDKPWHVLINADNYHALQLLLNSHERKIDLIYIDPPYNTGARDWKYNNDYVDKSDVWRHSKWLSMMKKRLLLAKRLLKPDGVLIIAIDDNEARHLGTLLDELLPEFDATAITVVHNPRGNITNNFARTHEYAVFLIPKNKSLVVRTVKENVAPRKLRRWGHNSTRTARPTMFYPIYIKDGRPSRVGEPPKASFHPAAKNALLETGEVEIWPIVRETGQVELEQFIIGLGKMEMPAAAVKVRAELASENVDGLFREAHRRIGPGTDIHAAFRAEAEKKTDPALAKLELFALSGDAAVLKEISDHAEKRFAALEAKHRGSIRRTKAKRKEQYRKLQQAGRDPLYVEWDLPEQILEKQEGEVHERHLFCDGDGKFQTKLNTWETAVVKKWMSRDDFAGWLRNPPRKPWSFCVAYEHGGTKGFHPDRLLFRKSGDRLIVDVVEPHRTNQDDTYAKAKGLADYAETYGGDFGQLMMVKVEGSGDKALLFGFDVNERETRKKALALRSNEDVQGLFRPL
jgi:hypothetical protein